MEINSIIRNRIAPIYICICVHISYEKHKYNKHYKAQQYKTSINVKIKSNKRNHSLGH